MSFNQKSSILTDLQKCNYIPTMKDLVCNTIMEIMNSKLKKEQAKYYIRQWQKDNIIMIWLRMTLCLSQKLLKNGESLNVGFKCCAVKDE